MKLIHEIFDEIADTKSVKEKQQILLDNERPQFKSILKNMFDKSIKYKVKSAPKYKVCDDPDGLSSTQLEKQMFMIDRLYDIEGNNLSNERAENILINVLEIIPKRESDILCKIINKKMKVSGLTERLVRETYPDLLPEELVS
tara:strand:+ start:111 stop:539 length:429 start_codon:yes stop_codon:yes gene_type:complete